MSGTQTPDGQHRTPDYQDALQRAPDRLDDVPVGALVDLGTFTHRGKEVRPARVVDYLAAALMNRAYDDDGTERTESMSELEAVDALIHDLRMKFPTWFGNFESAHAAISPGEADISEHTLCSSEIRDRYFGESINPETHDIDPTDRESVRRVVVPFTAIALDELRSQMAADSAAQTDAAQRRVKRTVMETVHEGTLSEREVLDAVSAGLQALEDGGQR